MNNKAQNSKIDDHQQLRNKSVWNAILSSIPARMSGILLQIVSLPIAAIALGEVGFGIYAMLSSILAAITLSNIGVEHAATLHISRHLAEGKNRLGTKKFTTSLTVVTCYTAFIFALVSVLIIKTPIIHIIFSKYTDNIEAPINEALFLSFVFFVTQILSVFEAAQLANQRQYRLNLYLSAGTLLSATMVWVVAKYSPSIINILVAVHLPIIIARLVNALDVWGHMKPKLIDVLSVKKYGCEIIRDGLRFISGTSIANFFCHQFGILAVGIYASPLITATYAAVMNALIITASVSGIVATPFRSAIPEAFTRNDFQWLKNSLKKIYYFSAVYGLSICFVLAVFGGSIFDLWYQSTVKPKPIELLGAGVYFVLLTFEIMGFTFLSNTDGLKVVSKLMLLKAFVSAMGIIVFSYFGFFEYIFWILAFVNVFMSLIPFSRMTLSKLAKNGGMNV